MGPNPDLFNKLNQPFPSRDEADAAFQEFLKDMEAAREKHGIPNVLVVALVNCHQDDQTVQLVETARWGDPLLAEPMAAFVFGRESGRRQYAVDDAIAAGRRERRKEKKS